MANASLREVLETAMDHQRAGRLEQAERIYRHVLSQHPREANSLHLLGVIEYQRGRLEQSRSLIQQAIQIEPNSPVFHGNLAQVMARLNQSDPALAEFQRALNLRPDMPDVLTNLGDLLRILGRFDESLHCLRRAEQLAPANADVQNNLGNVLRDKGEYETAIAALRRAIQLGGDLPVYHNNLGNALMDAGKLDDAVAEFHRALQLDPNYAPAHNNLGTALRLFGRFDQALHHYRLSVQLGPEQGMHHFNLGLMLLLLGQFEEGWHENEWRWRVREYRLRDQFTQPMWDGSDLRGRRIVLYAEQGFGDAIQFSRYVPMVAQRNGKIVLACQSELATLFKSLDGVEQILTVGDQKPVADLRCPLMSLPMVFKTDLNSIPAPIPYLRPTEETISKWRERVNSIDGKLKIGIAWAGRSAHRYDHHRSMTLNLLEPILQSTDVKFFSLQKDRPPSGFDLIDWTAELTDFADTAGLIENLDLVITVDTAVAHLAGALGKPVWVLVPFVPDWRWLLNRPDSPWYPTMKLFRQPAPFDWNTPMQQIVEELGKFPGH